VISIVITPFSANTCFKQFGCEKGEKAKRSLMIKSIIFRSTTEAILTVTRVREIAGRVGVSDYEREK